MLQCGPARFAGINDSNTPRASPATPAVQCSITSDLVPPSPNRQSWRPNDPRRTPRFDFTIATSHCHRRACRPSPDPAPAAGWRGRGQAVPAHLSRRAHRRPAAARVRTPARRRPGSVVRADRQRTEPGEPHGGSAARRGHRSGYPAAFHPGRLQRGEPASARTHHVSGRPPPGIRRHHSRQPAR